MTEATQVTVSDYSVVATATHKHLTELSAASARLQGEYGRWLINTLWLMHSGSIAGLLLKANNGAIPYLPSLGWFVGGIVLAFCTGFSAWWNWNFTFAMGQYDRWIDHRMLTDPVYWPGRTSDRKVAISLWIAVAMGTLSLCCLVAGAYSVFDAWPKT